MPVLVLTGAHQVEKRTLLLNEKPFNDFQFLSMDDFDALRQANEQQAHYGFSRMVTFEVLAPFYLVIYTVARIHPNGFWTHYLPEREPDCVDGKPGIGCQMSGSIYVGMEFKAD